MYYDDALAPRTWMRFALHLRCESRITALQRWWIIRISLYLDPWRRLLAQRFRSEQSWCACSIVFLFFFTLSFLHIPARSSAIVRRNSSVQPGATLAITRRADGRRQWVVWTTDISRVPSYNNNNNKSSRGERAQKNIHGSQAPRDSSSSWFIVSKYSSLANNTEDRKARRSNCWFPV